jgi:molecular chaperone GrpE
MNDETKKHAEQDMPEAANDDAGPAVDETILEVGGADDLAAAAADAAADIASALDDDADDGESEEVEHDREAELEFQVSDLTDRLLRTAAEMENVRKRAQKDREDASKFATSKFAEDMLAVADNLARALQAVTDEVRANDASKGVIEGVDLTMKELGGVLERHGIVQIDTTGAKFDPNLHQAMFETETSDFEPGTVMQVLRSGYTIHGRLLRPAMVGIAKAPTA